MRMLAIVASVALCLPLLHAATPPKSASKPRATKRISAKVDPSREPKTFRGVPWGATETEADAIIKFGEDGCMDMSIVKREQRWCSSDFEMGTIEATSNFVFAGGTLVQVIVSYYPSEYEYVRGVFVEKYGPPTTTTVVPVRTKAGVEYANDTTIWRFPNITIEMHRYGTTIERGATYLTSNAWTAEQTRKESESKKKAADSF